MEGNMDRALERRMVLRGAGVAGASVVGVAMSPIAASADQEHGGRHGLLGAWRIVHTDDPGSGGAKGTAIVAFAAGGVITVEETPDGTLGLGAWKSRGQRFRARFFESQPGSSSEPGVVVEIMAHGRLHGDHISGTYHATVRGAADDDVVAMLTGMFTGQRLRV
jgi:hypothetical protein